MERQFANRQLLRYKAATLSEAEISEVLDYINLMQSLNEQARDPHLLDDLLLKMLLTSSKPDQLKLGN